MKTNRLFLACVAALALAACGGGTELTATLSGDAEKPTAVETTGTGRVKVTVDTKLEVSGSFEKLPENAIYAHIHGPVDATGVGPVFCDLKVPSGTSGPIEAGSGDKSCGDKELTEAEQKDFEDGKMYVNIHTDKNRTGEIRGDLKKEE